MYRILYRFLVPGWSAKPLVSAHDRIMGTHRPETLDLRAGSDPSETLGRPETLDLRAGSDPSETLDRLSTR